MRLGGKDMKKNKNLSIIATFLSLPLLVGCAGATHSYYSSKPPYTYDPSYNPGDKIDPIKVFDYFQDDGYPDPLTFELKEFINSPFALDDNQNVIDNKGNIILNAGAALYLYDVNNDGYRDFCVTKESKVGDYSTSLIIHDLRNNYEILNYKEEGRFNYFFEIRNNNLGVYKTHNKYNETRYGEGLINFTAKNYIKWDNIFDIKSVDFTFTYADASHTAVSKARKNNDTLYADVDRTAIYLIELDVRKNIPVVYPEGFYDPISFVCNSDDVVIFNPLKNNPFKYAIYFQGSEDSFSIDMNFSGFSKTLNFDVKADYISPFTRLKLSSLIAFASQFSLPNIEGIDVKEEKLGTLAPESSRGIGTLYQFTDDSYLSSLEEYLDEVLFEVNEDEFVSDDLTDYTYIIKTDEGDYEFMGKDRFFFVNDRCFMARKPLEMNRFSASSTSYFFDSEVYSISMEPYAEGTSSARISNPEVIVMNKKLALDEKIMDAYYTFELRGAKYYVLNSKKFMDASGRYVYEIISDADFSSIFA